MLHSTDIIFFHFFIFENRMWKFKKIEVSWATVHLLTG